MPQSNAHKTQDPPAIIDGANTAGYSVVFRAIDELTPYAKNSRTHSDAQVAQLAASVEEFGFTNPVLADAKGIVAGHGRVLAARQLYGAGRTIRLPNGSALPAGTLPVIDCTGWSDAQRKAYVIWDNRSAEQSGWDRGLLGIEIGDLKAEGFNLDLVGFDPKALEGLLSPAEPIADEPGDAEALDEPEEGRIINCPKCGHDFSILEPVAKKKTKGARKPAGKAKDGPPAE